MCIRELRNNRGLTLVELSSKVGIDIKRVKIIERELDSPNEIELTLLSTFFGVHIQELLGGVKKSQKVIGEGYVTSKSDRRVDVNQPKQNNPKVDKIPIVDLFCGIGGLSYGFEQTGKYMTIAGLDLLRDRIDTFQINHPQSLGIVTDIRRYKPAELDEILPVKPRIIVGGAPCQGFSSIRPFRTLSEDDERNNLFKHFGNYIEYFKPDWFVFENVVGLLTHKGGETLMALIAEFEGNGYDVTYKIINSAYFGVPQMRERLIIVGNRVNKQFIWPKPTHYIDSDFKSMAGGVGDHILLPTNTIDCKKAVSVIDAVSDLTPIESGKSAKKYMTDPQNEYQEYLRERSLEVDNHVATIHSDKMMQIIKESGYNINAVRHLVTSGFSSCYSRLEPDRPAVTLTVNFTNPSSNKCIHPIQNRALTPREGARLQGFPDHFAFAGSKTQIVKQIGNAVPPILSRVIAEQIFNLSQEH